MTKPSSAEEILIPLPMPRDQIVGPSQIRSTLIASSLRALRDRGLEARYVSGLDPQWRAPILETVAGIWLPFDAGLAHYAACDKLELSVAEQLAIGREVGDRIQGTFLGTMIRASRGVGVTPWIAFPHVQKLYERIFDGGAFWVAKTGPKDVRMELVGNPIVRFGYFRNAMRGVWLVALELFASKGYVHEVGRTESSYKVKISWA
ncbi:MAG TPA: hypothetical protein VGI39_16390 [Polyangiaceae bacterium]|jgi:hypothetical protein